MTHGEPPAQRAGVILYDKPAGITSHDVVREVRRELGRRVKVGHAGTLDPFATGLLLVLVGRATRVQRFLTALPKRYHVIARFGATSTTGDPEGEIVQTGVAPEGDLTLPSGTIRQVPPAYSAVKLAGRRAYALARAGNSQLDLPEREVHVYRFTELWREGDRRGFEIECSSGTYVRSLVADLGDAYCEQLRRDAIGPFEVERADPNRLIPLEEALAFMPECRLDREAARLASHGTTVPATSPTDMGDRDRDAGVISQGISPPVVRLVDDQGLIALAESRDGGRQLKPVVGLRG